MNAKQVNVIHIPKQGKDDHKNDRSVDLSSCACKTMEKLINVRHSWFHETNRLLFNIQCGFHQGISSYFTTIYRNAFAKKKHAVSTLIKNGISKDLLDVRSKGKLPTLNSFLFFQKYSL